MLLHLATEKSCVKMEIYHISYTGEQPWTKEPRQLSEGELCLLLFIVNGRNYVYQGCPLLLLILATASAKACLDLKIVGTAGGHLTNFGMRKGLRKLYLRWRSRCVTAGFGYHLLLDRLLGNASDPPKTHDERPLQCAATKLLTSHLNCAHLPDCCDLQQTRAKNCSLLVSQQLKLISCLRKVSVGRGRVRRRSM